MAVPLTLLIPHFSKFNVFIEISVEAAILSIIRVEPTNQPSPLLDRNTSFIFVFLSNIFTASALYMFGVLNFK